MKPRVVLGVSGGIAAYKAVLLLRIFTESGWDVTVVPTESALRFVGEPTWSALSGKPVSVSVWDSAHDVPHVRLGQDCDLVVVAPATADLLARAAAGLADDLLTNTLLTARCPVLMAPAMHTEMWQHPATQANVATLRARGVHVLEPAVGRLTGADSGPGRLPDIGDIEAAAAGLLSGAGDLGGRTVLVTAGGTREPVDPVRFLGNRSTGMQGWALAETAARRGARVILVAANVDRAAPPGCELVSASTALELRDAVMARVSQADAVVMAAAVADFRPALVADAKIKKSHDGGVPAPIVLERNPDILCELVAARGDRSTPVLVGFAAETGDGSGSVLDHGRDKLRRKGCDVLVVNDVRDDLAFGSPDNAVVILGRDGRETNVARAPKRVIANAVWDATAELISLGGVSPER